MQWLKNRKWLLVLMAITILGITSFQVYWLHNTYEREKKALEIRSNMTFRETVQALQASKIKVDELLSDSALADKLVLLQPPGKKPVRMPMSPEQKVIGLVNVLRNRIADTAKRREMMMQEHLDDLHERPHKHRRGNRLVQFLYEMDSLQQPLQIKEIEAAFAQRMQQQNLDVSFEIKQFNRERQSPYAFNEVTVGFARPVTYQLQLQNTTPYLLNRILAPIFLSLFIVGFTILSFVLLYRNLQRQRKLATIKNDFISNITHELKTPIATVSVAIEALRSFNTNLDAKRTKEYLDISHNELQRLSLLVDKVLKLSMFEKKEVELKYEPLNMKDLIDEVTSSMRLQFEKYRADVLVETCGDTTLEGDRLHLVSVIFNLLDNALKYSTDRPQINITAKGNGNKVLLTISDNGIGIPQEYHDKVFEKFFRVPTGNLHNAKGYGLGLSYVAHVVKKHKGSIRVESAEGSGSRFIISLPKHTTS